MQRWILFAGIALFGIILSVAGAYFGLKEYRLGKPTARWVPLSLSIDMPATQQAEYSAAIQKELTKDEVLRQIVSDAKLKEGLGLATEEEALAEFKRRMFIELGTFDSPNGKVPSINMGVKGTVREKEVLDAVCMTMMRVVSVMLGLDPQTGMPKQPNLSPALPPALPRPYTNK